MTAEMIRQLPERRALVIRGGMSPVITRLPMAWNDPAYRKARRDNWAAALASTPEAAEINQPPAPEADSWPWPDLEFPGHPFGATARNTTLWPWP